MIAIPSPHPILPRKKEKLRWKRMKNMKRPIFCLSIIIQTWQFNMD